MYILYYVHCDRQLLIFATDAELYKNVTNMIYNYNTLL